MTKPWSNIRILDLSQGIAGPYCAQIMASQGAQVIKVEPPTGDWSRFISATHADHSAMSLHFNQGKLGVALDAKHPEGRALLSEMIQNCQVVIQNFRPGVAQRLGIDYETLRQNRPDIICVSITGYGEDGPAANLPATDSVMQADSGLMYMNRSADDTPRRIGMPMADAITGMYAAQALSAALYNRLANGEGSYVHTSLFEASLALQGMGLIEHAMAGPRSAEAVSAPNGIYATADGQMTVVTLNTLQFEKLCEALGSTDWLQDPRFATNEDRMQHRKTLDDLIEGVLVREPTQFWIAHLTQHQILHSVIRDYATILDHPQVHHLQPFQTHNIAGMNAIPAIASPFKQYRTPQSTAPTIGEHTQQALEQLGIAPQRIQALCEAGVLKQGKPIS